MPCKYLGWLINQGYAWCIKDNRRNPFKECENCPDREEFDWGETYSTDSEPTEITIKGDKINGKN